MNRLYALMLGLFVALASGLVYAQGILVIRHPVDIVPLPRPVFDREPPPNSYKIKELAVAARLRDQVAQVQVSQTFVNTGSRPMEVQFLFPLPYDGAIDQLTLMVDGKEYEAKLMPAKEARGIYESYIRRNQDPALLEWMGTGMFQTSVFPVPAGAERKVTLRYSQLLRKYQHLTDFLFPLGTAKYTSKPVERVAIDLTIESPTEIKNVYSPTHQVVIERPDAARARVKFESKDQVPVSDFRLFFDSAPGKFSASVLSYRPDPNDDGYFMLLASPQITSNDAQPQRKNIVFVLDTSGSMSGKKMEQAKEALKFVVNNLHAGDAFNIVSYNSTVETFRPELVAFDDKTRGEALGFVNGLNAGGGTNIEGGLTRAFEMLKESNRPSFIVFLTDGRPTVGETNEAKIVAKARGENRVKARLISFGVGYDLNSRLLDRLSHENFGESEYVRPDENIETHVGRVYARISSPVLTDVAVNFEFDALKVEEGPPINRRYPRAVRDVFAGEQLVIVGRYKKAGAAKVTIAGKVGDREEKYDFPAELTNSSGDQTLSFVEKLWAVRRVGEIIDELDLNGKNEELVKELVALSTRHGILTPYTSFLADDQPSPGGQPGGPLAAGGLGGRRGVNRALEAVDRLAEADGKAGVAQRAEKRNLQLAERAPQGGGFGLPAAPSSGPGGAPAASAKPQADAVAALPTLRFRDIDSDKEVVAAGVQQAGDETLYRRGNLWIAASAAELDPEKDAAKIKVIERFSDEYFRLVAQNTAAENAVLARQQAGEELLIVLRGQAYRIQ